MCGVGMWRGDVAARKGCGVAHEAISMYPKKKEVWRKPNMPLRPK